MPQTNICICTLPMCTKESVADTLEELWISYNNIEKLKGITALSHLKVKCDSMCVNDDDAITCPMSGAIHV